VNKLGARRRVEVRASWDTLAQSYTDEVGEVHDHRDTADDLEDRRWVAPDEPAEHREGAHEQHDDQHPLQGVQSAPDLHSISMRELASVRVSKAVSE
jgi:hypothetical protein